MVWTIAAILLGGVAVFGAVVWMVRPVQRRRAKRGACRGCGYALSGGSGDRCPECGLAKGAWAPRRKRVLIGGAVCAVLAGLLWAGAERESEGLDTRLVPTTLLCLLERAAPSDPWGPSTWVARALRMRTLGLHRPPLLWAIPKDFPTADLSTLVEVPRKWPAGKPLRVFPDLRTAAGSHWVFGTCEIRSPQATDQVVWCPLDALGSNIERMYGAPIRYELEIPTPGVPGNWTAEVVVRIHAGEFVIRELAFGVAVRLVAPGERVLTPVAGPEIDALVRDGLLGYSMGNGVDVIPPRLREQEGLRVQGIVELLRGERVVASQRLGSRWEFLDSMRLPPEETTSPDDPAATAVRPGLIVRFRGTEAEALANVGAKAFWDGVVEIPLDELLKRKVDRDDKRREEEERERLGEK